MAKGESGDQNIKREEGFGGVGKKFSPGEAGGRTGEGKQHEGSTSWNRKK